MRTTAKTRVTDRYFELIRAFPLRRLKSPSEHVKAKRIYLNLSNANPDQGTREYLDVLADLIIDYEKRTKQTVETSGVTAAELLRHRMQERNLTISALAKEIGIAQPNLSEMLSGRRDWSKAAIRALSKKFDIRAERFLA